MKSVKVVRKGKERRRLNGGEGRKERIQRKRRAERRNKEKTKKGKGGG